MRQLECGRVNATPAALSRLAYRGVPAVVRRPVWQLLVGSDLLAEKNPGVFEALLEVGAEPSEGLGKLQLKVRNDVGRTFPDAPQFQAAAGQQDLYDVLFACARFMPAIGYCQGMNFLAGVALMHMDKTHSFWFLVQMLRDCQMDQLFTVGMQRLRTLLYQHDRLVEIYVPKVHAHLRRLGVDSSVYAAPWYTTLFAYSFPLPLVCRIWDVFFVERDVTVLFQVALAVLRLHQDEVSTLSFEGVFVFFKSLQHSLPPADVVMYRAAQIRRDPLVAVLKRLEVEACSRLV